MIINYLKINKYIQYWTGIANVNNKNNNIKNNNKTNNISYLI